MIGFYDLPNNNNNVYVFYAATSGSWQTWQKPKGCKYAQFLVIGGGGGGGAGGSAALNTSRSGGAGGGSSGVSRLFVPLSSIPDVLYIQVGVGGLGGTATGATGNAGGVGTLSYVSILPDLAVANSLIRSGNANAGGGNGGSGLGSSNATAGIASTVFTVVNGLLSHIGHSAFVAGQAGGGGGNINQSGTAITLAGITSGGAGAAGVSTTNRNGANITGAGFVPTVNGGNPTTLSQADSGFNSFNAKLLNQRLPLFFTGGAGGYSINTTTGGNGGNGAFGCGGGGGGAGITGGKGGDGGNGLVIITCW